MDDRTEQDPSAEQDPTVEQEPRTDEPPRRLSRRAFIAATATAVAVPAVVGIAARTADAAPAAAPAPGPSPGPSPSTAPNAEPLRAPSNATYLLQQANSKLPNAVVTGEPVPRLYVNSLVPSASDTDPYRGSLWKPYASAEQALKEANNQGSSFSKLLGSTGGVNWSVDIDIGPGPAMQFPPIPAGGYPSNQTFAGQAHRLTQSWVVPPFVRLIGHGAQVHGFTPVTGGDNLPGYNTLLYGNVNGPLLQYGTANDAPSSPTYVEALALCNVHTQGIGFQVFRDQPGVLLRSVQAYGCGSWGMQFSNAGVDTMTIMQPQVEFCGQNGSSGGLQIGVSAIPTQALIFIGASVRNNTGCDIQISGNNNPSGTDGGATVFIVPRLGTAGVLLQGAKGVEFWAPYTESVPFPTNNPIFTFDFLEGSNPIVAASWSSGTATITTATPHGFSPGQDISVIGCKPTGFNVNGATVKSVPSNTQLTYSLGSNPGSFVFGSGALVANDASDQKTWCRDIFIRGPGRIHNNPQEPWLGMPATGNGKNLSTRGSMAFNSTTLNLTLGTLSGNETGQIVRVQAAGSNNGNKDLVSPIVSIQSSTKCTLQDPCLNTSGVKDEPCTVPPYKPTPWAFWLRAAFGCTIQDIRPISNNSGDPYRYYAVIAPSTTDRCHLDLTQFTNEGNNYPPDAYMVGMVDG
jgi:hypothetical protein